MTAPNGKRQGRTLRVCNVPGCGREHRARNLCTSHYSRLLRHGDPLAWIPLGEAYDGERAVRTCSVPGCGREHRARRFCATHYRQWLEGKVPGAIRRYAN